MINILGRVNPSPGTCGAAGLTADVRRLEKYLVTLSSIDIQKSMIVLKLMKYDKYPRIQSAGRECRLCGSRFCGSRGSEGVCCCCFPLHSPFPVFRQSGNFPHNRLGENRAVCAEHWRQQADQGPSGIHEAVTHIKSDCSQGCAQFFK